MEQHLIIFAHLPLELKGTAPVTDKTTNAQEGKSDNIITRNIRDLPPLHEIVKERPSVIVELDPPKKLDTTKFFKGAKALKEQGIDAITLADNSLASAREFQIQL